MSENFPNSEYYEYTYKPTQEIDPSEDAEALRRRLLLEEEEREAKVFLKFFSSSFLSFSLFLFFLFISIFLRKIEEIIVAVNVVNLKKDMFVNFNLVIVVKNFQKQVIEFFS